ncbi:choice-of-anchor R domain-containing protein [Microcystis wesenbergii]|uniref:choice-of-anchor R domain-containing protein n=1 Tax=Microcystis wesenbergii TaxID=44823 RepID=UPI0030D11BE7
MSVDNDRVRALAFTLPAGHNYSLDNVILRLRNLRIVSPIDIPLVQIRNDGGINPGSTVLASFTNPPNQGPGTFDYSFTPTAPFTFIAGTKYWLTVASTQGQFGWNIGTTPGINPTGIATLSGNRVSNDGGSTFSNFANFNSFQINATKVPEPGAIAALSLFGLGLLGVKGRRNKG